MSSSSRRTRSLRVRALIVLALVFGSGALASAAVSGAVAGGGPASGADTPEADGLEALGLTAAQHRRIGEILEARQPRADSIVRQALVDLRVLMDSTNVAVRSVLTAEQAAAYDQLIARRSGVRAIRRIQTTTGQTIRVDTIQ